MKIFLMSLLDRLCVLKIHMYPISPNWDLRILTLSCVDRLTFWHCFFGSCLSGHMTVFKRIITVWYLRFFLFLSRLVLTAHSEVRGMQRDVSQAIPTPFSCPDTSLCAYWENGVNPFPRTSPFSPTSEEMESIFSAGCPGAFPLWS